MNTRVKLLLYLFKGQLLSGVSRQKNAEKEKKGENENEVNLP